IALEGWRKAVGRIVQAGQDPQGFLDAEFFKPRETPSAETAPPLPEAPALPTVREAYAEWISQQVAPLIRKAQRRDYRRHLDGYVLPHLGDRLLADLAEPDISALQATLLQQAQQENPAQTLSVRYVRNIIVGSFRPFV